MHNGADRGLMQKRRTDIVPRQMTGMIMHAQLYALTSDHAARETEAWHYYSSSGPRNGQPCLDENIYHQRRAQIAVE